MANDAEEEGGSMSQTRAELQEILDALPDGQWLNPNITSWDAHGRTVYTLLATKPGSGELYYYDEDSRQFEQVEMPGG